MTSSESSLHKVVVRTRKGDVIPGFAQQEPFKATLKIIDRKGKEQQFRSSSLKAVFFVKDFQGDPKYHEIKFLSKQEVSPKVWIRVEFFDGEVLEGTASNDLDLVAGNGFLLWPSDEDTNNECVYIFKSSLKGFQILSAV